jgi:hypothetical protein
MRTSGPSPADDLQVRKRKSVTLGSRESERPSLALLPLGIRPEGVPGEAEIPFSVGISNGGAARP